MAYHHKNPYHIIRINEAVNAASPLLSDISARPPQLSLPLNEHAGKGSGHSVKREIDSVAPPSTDATAIGPPTPSEFEHVSQDPTTEPQIWTKTRETYEFVEFWKHIEEVYQLQPHAIGTQSFHDEVELYSSFSSPTSMLSRCTTPSPIIRSMSPDSFNFFYIGDFALSPKTRPEVPRGAYFHTFTNVDRAQSLTDVLHVRREDLPPYDKDVVSKSTPQLCGCNDTRNVDSLEHVASRNGCLKPAQVF